MQTMLRLVGFGDNAGSGFPTILDVWKSEGWIKPELIVTLDKSHFITEDSTALQNMVEEMYPELPERKTKKKKV